MVEERNAENFALLEGSTTKLNAAVGASRAAVDSGFAPNDYQVGQTGANLLHPTYITARLSGIQHLAGMKDSKLLPLPTRERGSPIFKVADYGLVADLFEALLTLNQSFKFHIIDIMINVTATAEEYLSKLIGKRFLQISESSFLILNTKAETCLLFKEEDNRRI